MSGSLVILRKRDRKLWVVQRAEKMGEINVDGGKEFMGHIMMLTK